MKFSYPSGSKPLDGYTIKRGIGIGGFGEVYFALSDAGKEVALKKIQRNLDVELRGVRQCLNLKHVNLISLWDIKTNDQGESWVVMEYVPGPSLRDVVEEHSNGMPEEAIKSWFLSTASGCAYLHEHGIVHRDLKPGNIFCDEDEQVIKIGDYGLSKFISCSRRSGQTESVGTFHYMAPEIGKGVYGKEIDIYALGIILFEMLTGDVPFEGESTQEIIMKHLTADPDVDHAPAGFRNVIRKALRKDPELRYSSVPEMLADMPWPDVAANSQKIVSQHSVGPLVSGAGAAKLHAASHETYHHGSATPLGAQVVGSGSVLPPAIIDSDEIQVVQPDIVFGQLKDHSQAGERGSGKQKKTKDKKVDPIHFVDRSPSEKVVTVAANSIGDVSSRPLASNNSLTAEPAEPIARAVHTGFSQVGHWWTNANVSTPVKVIGLIVASIVVIQNGEWLLPLALGLGFVYLLYYTGRSWYQATRNVQEDGQLKHPQPKLLSRRELKLQHNARVRTWIRQRPVGDRATELLGSLLIGAFACMVLNLLGLAIGGSILDATIESWAVYAWLTTTSVVACWALLTFSKFWEDQDGHDTSGSLLRRLSMLAVGLAVGCVAFFASGAFSISPRDAAVFSFSASPNSIPGQFVFAGVPLLPAYLIFFAGLFGILRWWIQADPTRTTRLSILSVSLCLIWAAVFSHVLAVPMTPNCILAVVISVSVQLAAPWIHPEQREQICDQQICAEQSSQLPA